MSTKLFDELADIHSRLAVSTPEQRGQLFDLASKVYGELTALGWSPPTGTATRTTFDTATVTLSALAERVKALIDDLTEKGSLGP